MISEHTIELFEQIPYPIIIHTSGIIVSANSAAVELSGTVSMEKLIGEQILSFLEEDCRVKALAYMTEKIEYTNELFGMIDRNGIHKDIEINKSYFLEEDETYTFLIIKDVTEVRAGLLRASKIQKKSMASSLEEIKGLSFDTGYCPYDIVSGDFYYHEERNEHCIVGILGDVKGKGISAALNTSAMKILFYEALDKSTSTKAMASRINKGILRLLGEEYVAAIIFRIELDKKIISVTGAGISEFIYRNQDGITIEMVKGPFLGMFEEDMFENRHFPFEQGTEVIFYSDGLELAGFGKMLKDISDSETFGERIKHLQDVCTLQSEDDRTWAVFRSG